MDRLYHGSIISGIKQIETRSLLHGSDRKVVYLTDNIPYALFYIWDKEHNHNSGKHVTAWVRDGTAFYEEQFPDQMKTFYKGVSGYLYVVPRNSEIISAENREGMYYSLNNVMTEGEYYIADVYDELIKYELSGELKVRRYNEQSEERKNELTDLTAEAIVRENCFNNKENSEFYKRYFAKAWERAVQKQSR
ncbi:MAG: hypothetical protein NC452_14835 [Eubacterium sp.]|nr:hypothetical protein [Eubacterium sp.]